MLYVEIKNVEHRLHDGAAVVLSFRSCVLAYSIYMLLSHQRRELCNCHDHAERCAFDGHKCLVHVNAQCVCCCEEVSAFLLAKDVADYFDE